MNNANDKTVAAIKRDCADKPVRLQKRIGSTNYEVIVHFGNTSDETMADIVSRLLEREVNKIA